jgi:hypothetical protein
MSQQINLLPRAPAAPAISAARSLLLLSLWMLGITGYGEWQKMQADQLHQIVLRTEQHLQRQQAIVHTLQRKLGEPPGNLAAQIAALEPQTRVSKDLLARMKNGELGSIDGYGKQLVTLASIAQPGIWLTSISISNAGRSVLLEGRALKKEQVMRYVRQLNNAMKKFEMQFSEVDIVQISPSQPENMQQETTFSFKLH